MYSFVAQRVMVNLRYFSGLTDFLLIFRFQLLRRLGNFFICQQVRFFLVSMVSVQFCVDSAYQSLDRFYQTAYAVTIPFPFPIIPNKETIRTMLRAPVRSANRDKSVVKSHATPTRNCLSKKGSVRTKIRLGVKHL